MLRLEKIETPIHVLMVSRGRASSYRVNAECFSIEFTIRHDDGSIKIDSDLTAMDEFVMNLYEDEFDQLGGSKLYHICYERRYDTVEKILTHFFKKAVSRLNRQG